MNHKSSVRNHQSKRGFTLVELLVSITILGILIFSSIFIFNPLSQFSKAYDGQRKQDLNQIKIALDTYYNDHNCYPAFPGPDIPIPFGEEWKEGDMVYMKKVPQDPDPYFRSGAGYYNYNYQTDTSKNCPQWSILFTRLSDDAYSNMKDPKHCAAVIRKICPGATVSSVYNYCVILGNLDCNALMNQSAPNPYTPSENSTPTPTTPVPTDPVPTTPAGESCLKAQARYSCRVGQNPGNQCVVGGAPETGFACNDVGEGNGDFCDPNCNGDQAQ